MKGQDLRGDWMGSSTCDPTYSGSNPSFRAFCLFCCLCLSFNSFNYTTIKLYNEMMYAYFDPVFLSYIIWYLKEEDVTYIVVLTFRALLQIVLFRLKVDNSLPQFVGLLLQGVDAWIFQKLFHFLDFLHIKLQITISVDVKRLDTEGERNLLFFFQLLFGLEEVITGRFHIGELVHTGTTTGNATSGSLFAFRAHFEIWLQGSLILKSLS